MSALGRERSSAAATFRLFPAHPMMKACRRAVPAPRRRRDPRPSRSTATAIGRH